MLFKVLERRSSAWLARAGSETGALLRVSMTWWRIRLPFLTCARASSSPHLELDAFDFSKKVSKVIFRSTSCSVFSSWDKWFKAEDFSGSKMWQIRLTKRWSAKCKERHQTWLNGSVSSKMESQTTRVHTRFKVQGLLSSLTALTAWSLSSYPLRRRATWISSPLSLSNRWIWARSRWLPPTKRVSANTDSRLVKSRKILLKYMVPAQNLGLISLAKVTTL